MIGILQELQENELNQRHGDTNHSSLVSLPLKPPPSKRTSMIQGGENDNHKRQSIIIVEDYIPGKSAGELRSKISITDFKKQLSQKRGGHPIQYRPRIKDCNSVTTNNNNKRLLESYSVGDEMDTSLDCIVESLEQEVSNSIGNNNFYVNTTTRCVVCNRILYDLIPCESETIKECVCSRCIEPYNRMIETINKYDYLTPVEDNHKSEFSNKLKQTLRDILKS